MVFSKEISPKTKAYTLLLLKERYLSVKEISKKVNVSIATIYRCKKEGMKDLKPLAKRNRGGRPKKLTNREERIILREIPKLRDQEGNFYANRLMERVGLNPKMVSSRTIRRFLKRKGYKYIQARKKGVLTDMDLTKRFRFAKYMKTAYNKDVWTSKMNFYLDGVSFFYKTKPAVQAKSPRGRIWRKPSEGLTKGCTAKGNKEGSGGKVVKVMVAISHQQGVLDCEQYDCMNGNFFESYVKRKFPRMFKKAKKNPSRLWLQDGDPSQNCAAARKAFTKLDTTLLSIPPRSPDINPIENMFHLVRKELTHQAIAENITKETYEQFSSRVIRTITNFSSTTIDKIIETMDHRMDLIIKNKGNRTKY